MKRNLLILTLIFCSFALRAQENLATVSGGYVFTNLEDTDDNANGFRINGLFEYNPRGGKLAHGLSVGYVHTSASNTENLLETEYNLSTFPVYYAPKLLFGNESFKGFVKGALGMHITDFKLTGAQGGDIHTWDAGFYGGASLGIMKYFSERIFVNVEYEWAYLSNSAYRDGFLNTAMMGVGIRL